MGHHDHHHHVDPEAGDARIAFAVGLNLLLTVAQIVGGVLSGSLALIADALHNLSDAVSLLIAWIARKVARRPATARMTFGYGRAEVVAALVNYTTLIILGLYLASEGVQRLFDPQPVDGWIVVIVAGAALVIDLATAALTLAMARGSVNVRAAFAHNLADALGSVAVILAGTAVLLYDWRLVDPLVTLAIAGYVLWMSINEIGAVIRILMLAAPEGLDTEDVVDALRGIDGVAGVHHAHLWSMQEHEPALQAHLVIGERDWARCETIRDAVKASMEAHFGIGHVTLELERAENGCDDAPVIGHTH